MSAIYSMDAQIRGDKVLCVCARYFELNFCNYFHTYINVCHFTCTEQKMPDDTEVHRPLQTSGSTVWKLLYVTLLVPKFRRVSHIFGKFVVM
jgi:hypothetical protein